MPRTDTEWDPFGFLSGPERQAASLRYTDRETGVLRLRHVPLTQEDRDRIVTERAAAERARVEEILGGLIQPTTCSFHRSSHSGSGFYPASHVLIRGDSSHPIGVGLCWDCAQSTMQQSPDYAYGCVEIPLQEGQTLMRLSQYSHRAVTDPIPGTDLFRSFPQRDVFGVIHTASGLLPVGIATFDTREQVHQFTERLLVAQPRRWHRNPPMENMSYRARDQLDYIMVRTQRQNTSRDRCETRGMFYRSTNSTSTEVRCRGRVGHTNGCAWWNNDGDTIYF